MEKILLAQASNHKPEVVGQRTIISEEDLAAWNQEPEAGSLVSFMYVIAGIALLIAAGWAVQKLFSQDKPEPKPVRKAPLKTPARPRKIAKS